eukprot:2184150-Prymnesium_polylepis.1
MRQQDGRAQLARAEARPLVVQHHPDVVLAARGVPEGHRAPDVLECLLEQQRALVGAPAVLTLLAPK